METINLSEVKQKLTKQLTGTGWDTKLQFFLEDKLYDILEYLLKEAQDGRRFVPKVPQIFKAFESCPLDKVKVVILGQSPYPYIGVPDGLAFSCSQNGKRIEKSLSLMLEQINNTVYGGKVLSADGNLERWAEQGVLLFNVALTTNTRNPESHILKWKALVSEVLDILVYNKQDCVFIFMGKHAQEWFDTIPDNFLKIKTAHPASAAYLKTKWDCNDCFNKTNKFLLSIGSKPITW